MVGEEALASRVELGSVIGAVLPLLLSSKVLSGNVSLLSCFKPVTSILLNPVYVWLSKKTWRSSRSRKSYEFPVSCFYVWDKFEVVLSTNQRIWGVKTFIELYWRWCSTVPCTQWESRKKKVYLSPSQISGSMIVVGSRVTYPHLQANPVDGGHPHSST